MIGWKYVIITIYRFTRKHLARKPSSVKNYILQFCTDPTTGDSHKKPQTYMDSYCKVNMKIKLCILNK